MNYWNTDEIKQVKSSLEVVRRSLDSLKALAYSWFMSEENELCEKENNVI